MKIGKSEYIELNGTHCYTEKFNVPLSLCRVLGVTLYFSEDFLKAATGGLTVAEVLWPLRVTVICFLRQESNLWSPVPQ